MGREKSPFYLLFCALLASCGPVCVSTSEEIADSTSTSSYFRFDTEDVYASCGGALSSKMIAIQPPIPRSLGRL